MSASHIAIVVFDCINGKGKDVQKWFAKIMFI